MLKDIEYEGARTDIIESLSNDEDKKELLKDIEDEYNRAKIIASLSDDEDKKELLKDIEDEYNRAKIIASLNNDENKPRESEKKEIEDLENLSIEELRSTVEDLDNQIEDNQKAIEEKTERMLLISRIKDKREIIAKQKAQLAELDQMKTEQVSKDMQQH